MRGFFAASLLLFGLALFVETGHASFPVRSQGKPNFVANCVVTPGEGEDFEVELRWEIPYRELSFRPRDQYFRAEYQVGIVFLRSNQQVRGESWNRRVRVDSIDEARSREGRTRGRREIGVPEGEYLVRVTIEDRVARATSFAEGRLKVSRAGRQGLFDLRLVRKSDEGVLPNPAQEVPIGEEGHFVRVRLAPREGLFEYRLRWSLKDSKKEKVAEADTLVTAVEAVAVDLALPSERLSWGEHSLEVRLAEDVEGVRRVRSKLLARLTPAWFARRSEDALDILEILAEPDEVRELRKAKGEDWERAVEGFWSRRDQSPEDSENPYRDRVVNRLEVAEQEFQEPFKTGWKTDRGRILLKLGRPDRRTVREAGFSTPATEIWEYGSHAQVFVFVDVRGTGEFWLRG